MKRSLKIMKILSVSSMIMLTMFLATCGGESDKGGDDSELIPPPSEPAIEESYTNTEGVITMQVGEDQIEIQTVDANTPGGQGGGGERNFGL